jgi:hypothetical protein
MTSFQNLPVFKSSYDLLLLLFMLVKHFPREYKYSLGDTIKQETIHLVANIYKANTKADKTRNIELAQEKLELIKLYRKLCYDLKLLTSKKYLSSLPLLSDISKQLTGRKRYEG